MKEEGKQPEKGSAEEMLGSSFWGGSLSLKQPWAGNQTAEHAGVVLGGKLGGQCLGCVGGDSVVCAALWGLGCLGVGDRQYRQHGLDGQDQAVVW